jgi:hypothetical protein
MFAQVYQRKHDAKTEESCKHDARDPSPMYVEIRYIASCRVDPTAIGQHGGLEVVEDEVASRVVRYSIVAIELVAKLIQRCRIEV